MAGKAKSWYVSVCDAKTHKAVVPARTFFNVADAHKYGHEMAEKYPKPDFYILKENY